MRKFYINITVAILATCGATSVAAQAVSGRVSNNPPVYTAGDVSAMTLDTNGNLRVIQNGLNLALLNHTLAPNASTNATLVKASAGTIYEISVSNNSATPAYLKIYDDGTIPTCGAGTPAARYIVPGLATGMLYSISFPIGKSFQNGIGYCLTGGISNGDTTAVAASTFLINFTYR